ncbi:MAG: hypothetical protein C5B52_19345 [Bacteroidetes bacterium]|nr:MAG: hypothetical protein C5B52_19345 [Bacteroidota bacterium]
MKRRSFISGIGYSICAAYLSGISSSCRKHDEQVYTGGNPFNPINNNQSRMIDSTILYDDFNGGSLDSSWSVSGVATASIADSYLKLTGGSLSDRIINSASSLTKRLIYEVKIKIINTEDDYLMFGIEWTTGNILAQVHFSDLGGLWQLVDGEGGMGSVPPQPVSVNDDVILRIIRNDYDFIYEIENLTKQNKSSVTYTYENIKATSNYTLPRESQFFLKPFSGSINIDWVRVRNEEYQNADLMLIGHSIMDGCDAGAAAHTILERLQAARPENTFSLFAESGATTSRIASFLNSITELSPKRAVVLFGTNELLGGFSASEYIRDLKKLVTALENAQISVKICNVPPVDTGHSSEVESYNFVMNSEQAFAGKIIDIYSELKGLNGELVQTTDGFHPTAPGLEKIFTKINAAF